MFFFRKKHCFKQIKCLKHQIPFDPILRLSILFSETLLVLFCNLDLATLFPMKMNVFLFYEYVCTQARVTYEALLQQTRRRKRPFVVTGSYFAGIQRFAAIMAGKKFGYTWDRLKKSIPICLTAAMCGITLCGVGMTHIFNNQNNEEFVARWFQVRAKERN
jgi:hypothetical protein